MAELDRAAISVRLGQSRQQAGLTQEEIADLFEVHWRTVQNWESPKNDAIPWRNLDEWASTTGVSKEWLLHGETQPLTGAAAQLTAVEGRLVEIAGTLERLEAKLDRNDASERLEAIEADLRALVGDRLRDV